jgi:hypothetical protein
VRGRRCRKLLDDLKESRGYSYSKEEALEHTMWRARFGRGFGPVVLKSVCSKKNIQSFHMGNAVVGTPDKPSWALRAADRLVGCPHITL